MEEQIIQPHLVLYDTNHSVYMKSKLKEGIWSAVAKVLNLSNGKYYENTYSECKQCKKRLDVHMTDNLS
jgi:hypothetical protein